MFIPHIIRERTNRTEILDCRIRLPFETKFVEIGEGGYGTVGKVGIPTNYLQNKDGWSSPKASYPVLAHRRDTSLFLWCGFFFASLPACL